MIFAVTGGSGFVGGHLLRLAVEQGHSVRALARRPQPSAPGITWIAGDLAAPGALCAGADAVIHIAGTINARDRAAYDAGNVAGTASIVAAAKAAGVRRFVHVSSLAARESSLSDYGASKAAGEDIVIAAGFDAAVVRPPGVYGPGDRETLPLFQLAARGFGVVPGSGRASWIEVGDLARALLALATVTWRGLAEIDDGHGGYSHAEFARALGAAVGKRPVLLRLPTSVLGPAASVATRLARGKTPLLSRDRARYLAHPDWTVDPARALPAAVWAPATTLSTGLARTVAWYRAAEWLRSS